jgi:hypothetical protein
LRFILFFTCNFSWNPWPPSPPRDFGKNFKYPPPPLPGFSTRVHLWTYMIIWRRCQMTNGHKVKTFWSLLWPFDHLTRFKLTPWSQTQNFYNRPFDLLLVTRSKNSISWKMTQKQFRYPDHESLVRLSKTRVRHFTCT